MQPSNDMCTECKEIVGTVDMLLKSKATQEEIITALKSACSLLPASVSGVCSTVVAAYGQQAIDMLVQYLADPSQLCSSVGLCTEAERKHFKMPKFTVSNICILLKDKACYKLTLLPCLNPSSNTPPHPATRRIEAHFFIRKIDYPSSPLE